MMQLLFACGSKVLAIFYILFALYARKQNIENHKVPQLPSLS